MISVRRTTSVWVAVAAAAVLGAGCAASDPVGDTPKGEAGPGSAQERQDLEDGDGAVVPQDNTQPIPWGAVIRCCHEVCFRGTCRIFCTPGACI